MFNQKTRSSDAVASFCGRAPRVLGAMLIACGAQAAHAQWSVTNLHPSGAEAGQHSQLYDTQGGQQVGELLSFDYQTSRAGLWSGTVESFVDLTPVGATRAAAQGVHNGQQAGWVFTGDSWYASLWSGTAESVVNLAPAGAVYSAALAIHNGQQGGSVQYSEFGPLNAGIWHGTAESFVNLHPASMEESNVDRVRDGFQVGWATEFGLQRASLWSGTAESWTNLHPNAAFLSNVVDVHDGQQVGFIFDFSFNLRAGLWSGTAESFVDITPIGATDSVATGIFDGLQVGWADFDGITRASFWSGTAESWVDLHQYLDGSWSFSTASKIWRDGEMIYISGSGHNDLTGRDEALLWTYVIPAPGTGALFAISLSPIVRRRRRAA